MRVLPTMLLAILAFALVALPTAAAEEPMTWGCHSYEVYYGTNEEGAGVSTDDLAIAAAAAGQYVVVERPLSNGYLYYIGLGSEMNGHPGWQRWDGMCEDPAVDEYGGECFISCTF